MCSNIVIHGLQGLGDNIYQRPFVRSICQQASETVFLKTPWPQLYHDIAADYGLRFIKWDSRLRTQSKNENRFGVSVYDPNPCCGEIVKLGYGRQQLLNGRGLLGAMESTTGIAFDGDFSFEPDGRWLASALYFRQKADGRPIAILRPPTLRTEWPNEARNPCPKAMKKVIDEVCETHFVISVAELAAGEEWLTVDMPSNCLQLHQGELMIEELIAMCSVSDLLVGAPGFLIPLAAALNVPAVIVFGGYHAPSDVIDSRMNADHIICPAPDPFCRCFKQHHDCKKTIDDEVLNGAVGCAVQRKAMK